jgi:peptidoglycan hydrolase-like protein with peptidoglycan-binding domain
MVSTGIGPIDDLLGGSGSGSGPIDASADVLSVGFVQDLLIGLGFPNLPGALGAGRGTFGPHTTDAVRRFQQQSVPALPVTGAVDGATLGALSKAPWKTPFACCPYLTLVLDVGFTGMARLVSLTAQFEGAGRFTALNRNTDRAGLSFGLIQWAQKPGRLNELLRAFQAQQPAPFLQILTGGSQDTGQRLLAHTAKARGGTDDQGRTTDPLFDLVAAPWDARFLAAGEDRDLQQVQLDLAISDFTASMTALQAEAPAIRSERGVAFMLDVANQHGDAGAKSILQQVQTPGLSEASLLAAVQTESIARVRAQFGEGKETASTTARRTAFRTSALLSDGPVAI